MVGWARQRFGMDLRHRDTSGSDRPGEVSMWIPSDEYPSPLPRRNLVVFGTSFHRPWTPCAGCGLARRDVPMVSPPDTDPRVKTDLYGTVVDETKLWVPNEELYFWSTDG